MKNANYDNALTNLEEEKEIKLLVKGLLESIDQLNSLKNNTLLTENKKVLLEVSLWDNVKYYLGKLGRYKAGGKIFGKGKIDQEAGAKIQSIIDKKGNDLIKNLHNDIQAANLKDKGEFPNNRDPKIFLDIVESIAAIYDSIVESAKLKPNEKGYLPVDVANNIISDLREYVKKYLDVDVNWVSSIMDSEEERVDEKEVLITDSEEELDEDRAADVRAQLQAKGGDEKIDSERMKTLGSSRLPIFLSVSGGLLGLASWVVQTDWFREMFTKLEQLPPEKHSKIIQYYVSHHVNVDPNGFSYTLQNNLPQTPIDGAPSWVNDAVGLKLGPKAPVENLVKAAKFYGQGDMNKGIEVMSKQFLDKSIQSESIVNLKTQLANTATNRTVGDVFTHAEQTYGTSGELFKQTTPGALKGFIIKILSSKLVTWMSTGATVATIPLGISKLIATGPILGKLGIALVMTGAVVKLMRKKGQKQSRAATLNDLLQSLQYVQGPSFIENTPQPGDEEKEEPVKGGDEGKGKGGPMDDDLYNSLRNLFRFIVSTEKQFGAGPKKESVDELFNFDSLLTEAVYFRDKELVNYLNKNVSPKRVKAFENLLNRVEQIRNKIRNMKNTGDKVFDSLIAGCKDNPIYLTDFTKMFNIVSTNRQDYTNMAKFINGIFDEIRNSDYKKLPLIDKLGSMGKVVSDKDDLDEADPRGGRTQFERHAQDRSKFKKHLIEFLNDSIALFQYMLKKRKELAASGGQKTNLDKQKKKLNIQSNTQKSKPSGPTKYGSSMSESKNKENNFLNEELLRIKKLMK